MIKSILKLTFLISFTVLISCDGEEQPTPSNECGSEIETLTKEYTAIVMEQVNDPTKENCPALKSKVTEIINASRDAQNCSPNSVSVAVFKDLEESWQVVLDGLSC